MRVRRQIIGISLFTVLSQLFFFCGSPDETYNREVPSEDTVAVVPQENHLQHYSVDFQNLVQSEEGVFRGVRLGLSKDEVKKKERNYGNSEIQEENSQYLDYMVDYGSLENTDLRYKLNDRGNVEVIEVNIYPNSKAGQDSLYNEFYSYFSEKYGKGMVIGAGIIKWEQKNNDLLVQMGKRDTQKIHDINIIFSYLTREAAGILYEPLPEGL